MPGASEALRFDIFAKDEFSKSFDKLINKLPSVKTIAIAAAGGLAAVGTSLLAIAKTTATAYDQIGKFSDQTGLSTEFLSKMNVAAQFTDVNINTMNKSLERLQIGIGEASKGIGLAKDTLADFGIDLHQTNGQLHTTETILPLLADRFKEMTSETERTEAAQKLFGQRGTEMIKILKDGSEGLAKYSAEAEAMGLVVDKQGAANAAKFNDALYKVKGALAGLKNEIGERVMPIITGLSERFTSFTKDNRDRIIQFGQTVIKTITNLVEKSAYGVGLIIDSWHGLQMTWEVLKIGMNELSKIMIQSIDWIIEKMTKFMEAINFRGIFDEDIARAKGWSDTMKIGIETLQESADKARGNLQALVNEGMATSKIDEFINKAHTAIDEIRELGTAEITGGGGGITEGPGGVIFDLSQFDLEKENYQKHMEDLAAMHDEYFLTDQEKLDQWYIDNLGKYSENNDAMIQLREIYDEKQRELDEQQAELDERLAKRKMKTQAEAFGKIAAIGKAFGADFFKWTKGAAIAEAMINTYLSAISAFAKAGGYPWGIFPAAASIAYGLAQVATISQQSYAHGGLTNVPREQTMLVDEGERILSPNQNADLTKFMADGGSGGTVVIENMNILPNATNAELLLELNKNDWDEIVEYSILPAIRRLTDRGFAIA